MLAEEMPEAGAAVNGAAEDEPDALDEDAEDALPVLVSVVVESLFSSSLRRNMKNSSTMGSGLGMDWKKAKAFDYYFSLGGYSIRILAKLLQKSASNSPFLLVQLRKYGRRAVAVYTALSTEEIEKFLENYALGTLRYAKGIAEGVENTNYMIDLNNPGDRDARYILTVYEKRVEEKDLPFFMALMQHFAQARIPCPLPVIAKNGEVIQHLRDKSAALITFLNGASPPHLQPHHTAALGATLAQMHYAAGNFAQARANTLSLNGWEILYKKISARANEIMPELCGHLERELAFLRAHWPTDLPRGVIHADLFPDNVFFEGEQLSGVIDFYFACNDFFMYDLAIALNAWCFEATSGLHLPRARALLSAYQTTRRLSEAEKAAFPVLARGAALRFLLTRAHDWLFRAEGALVTPKDPMEYYHKLSFHRAVKGPEDYGF